MARRRSLILLQFLLGLAALAACRSAHDLERCTPGAVRECQSCSGERQRCEGDPARWSTCDCRVHSLGAPCLQGEECGASATCLENNSQLFLGGGPVGGLCVAECTFDPGVCDLYEGTLCVQTDGLSTASTDDDSAFCLHQCTLGSARLPCPEHFATVCDRRLIDLQADMSLNDDIGICRPLCDVDADCASDREDLHCDRVSGTCVPALPAFADGFGSLCHEEEAANCQGLCLSPDHGAEGLCSHACSFSGPGNEAGWCNFDGNRPTGYCALALSSNPSPGEVGFCTPMCTLDSDCASSEWSCLRYETASDEHRGVCVPNAPTDQPSSPALDAGLGSVAERGDAG